MILKVIFFHIYNVYYKDGNYKNDIPYLTAFGIVACSLSIIIVVSVLLLLKGTLETTLSKESIILLTVVCLSIFSYIFLIRSRYKSIYQEIKGSKWDNVGFKALSWVIVVAGFAFAGLFAYIFNQRQ
jgi:hypothetical protein